jgi:hypothetical protein
MRADKHPTRLHLHLRLYEVQLVTVPLYNLHCPTRLHA